MNTDLGGDTFRLVVSDKKENKLGVGGSTQKTARSLYFYVERIAGGSIFLQALNDKSIPAGEKKDISLEQLLESYHPEPLVYYNKVKPLLDGVASNLEKGEKHLEKGRTDAAEKCFKRALVVDTENIRGLFGLGMTYLSAGKTEDAGEILDKIMNLEMAFDEEHAHLFNQFGIKMRKAGMLPQALDYYEKALALNGQDEHLLFNVCRIHYEMKDFDSALDVVAKALRLNNEFPEGKMMLEHLLKLKPELANRLNEAPGAAEAAKTDGLDLDGVPWDD
jgi:tetratricopeptide (TPR) repeat protein